MYGYCGASDMKLSLLTQVPECGAGLKALRKILFIGRQAGANQTSVGEGKAKLLHFLFGFLRRPALFGHTVGCNHHSRAVITQRQWTKTFLPGLFRTNVRNCANTLSFGNEQCQGSATYCIPRCVTILRSLARDPRRSTTMLIPILARMRNPPFDRRGIGS